jgi:hypothetical protein
MYGIVPNESKHYMYSQDNQQELMESMLMLP